MSDPLSQVMDILDPTGTLHAAVAEQVTPEQRVELVAVLEKHADWHDSSVFGSRAWIPVETAADAVLDAGWKP